MQPNKHLLRQLALADGLVLLRDDTDNVVDLVDRTWVNGTPFPGATLLYRGVREPELERDWHPLVAVGWPEVPDLALRVLLHRDIGRAVSAWVDVLQYQLIAGGLPDQVLLFSALDRWGIRSAPIALLDRTRTLDWLTSTRAFGRGVV